MTVSTSQLAAKLAPKHLLEPSMLPDNFDPYFFVTGVKRRDWLAPVQPKQPQG